VSYDRCFASRALFRAIPKVSSDDVSDDNVSDDNVSDDNVSYDRCSASQALFRAIPKITLFLERWVLSKWLPETSHI
jgi:hypothetical protein